MATRTSGNSQKHAEKSKKSESELFLPPLTPLPGHRQKPNAPWTRDAFCASRCHDRQRKRPYRVLHIGATPLMHACQQADRARVLRLLKEQEDTIGYRDRTLRSALHYCMDAATSGAVAAAAPELVNAPDAEGHTPLHLAVIAGDTQLVAVLLANGADVNAKDLEGHSVLHWATVCGEAECVRLVLAAGARPSTPDLRGGSALHYAAQCCGAAATAELAVPKKVGMKVLQTLLEFGADVNAKDEDGRQPILWAASAGSVEAVLALARAGGSAAAGASDKDGLTALHCAASRGHARCIEALVNLCGSQPDHVDDNGCSALHYAATLGHADATALILKLGADPNRQDRKGRTPALCAAAKGQLETLKILAQHGGSLHARTVRGTGVAHEAVASGRVELIKWLAKRRPSTLDVATQDGKTPLHVAALHGHLDACKVLLDHGARINAVLRTSKGNLMTALDAALYRGHRDCAKLIQMHGGATAQQLRTRKTGPNKVFAAKVTMTQTESSSDTGSSACRNKHPDLYYEERWIERRSRKRGTSKKLDRRGSRSFSEEEIRVSKSKSKRDRERRARSESSRYEDTANTVARSKRKRSRKRSSRNKHDYSETSSESGSCEKLGEEFRKGSSRDRMENARGRSRGRSKREKSTDARNEGSAGSKSDSSTSDDDDLSVSDDSLEEVVVVKRSLEKSEKVVSGKRSRIPRASSRETKLIRTKRCTKRTSKATKSKSDSEFGDQDSARKEEPGKSDENVENDVSKLKVDKTVGLDTRYRKDGTDSTSQEGVERVVVTAMVHKDQPPDTPKLPGDAKATHEEESSRKLSEGDGDSKSRMYDILEKADKLHNDLMMKAADLKKDVEEMKLHATQEKTQTMEAGSQGQQEEETGEAKGRSNVDETSISDSLEEDSQRGYKQLQQEDSTLKSDKSSSREENLADEVVAEVEPATETGGGPFVDKSTGGTVTAEMEKGKEKEKGALTPRTIVEDIPASDLEERKQLTQDETLKSKGTPQAGKGKTSTDTKAKVVKRTTEKNNVGRVMRKKKPGGIAKSPAKKIGRPTRSPETPTIARVKTPEEMLLQLPVQDTTHVGGEVEKSVKEPSEDKDQVDSARGKSVDLSTDSRDSAVLDDAGDGSMSLDTSGRKFSEEPSKIAEGSKDAKVTSNEKDSPSSTKNVRTEGNENTRFTADDNWRQAKSSARPSTGKGKKAQRPCSSRSTVKRNLFESSEDGSPSRSAIVAVIESPEWDDDEEVDKEIRKVIGENAEPDTEPEENNGFGGVVRILPSTSEEETPRVATLNRTPGGNALPEVVPKSINRLTAIQSPESRRSRLKMKQRRDSGGRDSGIEPSPRVSRIPRRTSTRCCPITEKQRALNMETITRDVQISMRRYHLERKIFFQLMELKRLQIRHGKTNEHVLIKRQVDAFHRAGMCGPLLGVAKYDQPFTFRDFEAFLYEQLRRLQRRSATPEFCTEAKQCTRKTHRCHHATSAYTAMPAYTYLGGGGQERTDHLPKIESRGRGQMMVEVTHGEEKQMITLPADKLDRTKRYFVTFTLKGDGEAMEKPKSASTVHRNTKSV